jgi:hypothetical protein
MTIPAWAGDKPKLDCKQGGNKVSIGETEWHTYLCSDDASMVFVSAKGNPSMPFVFIRTKSDKGYKLSGEGNGDKTYTELAFEDLKQKSNKEFETLRMNAKAFEMNKSKEEL